MTYTYATMQLSKAAYDEIKSKLLAAGYDHAISDKGLDMTHIMVTPPEAPEPLNSGDLISAMLRDGAGS